jgi:GMP synthase (glutamine-hydrolysing)
MKILCISHASFEKLGYIETWANKKNHVIRKVNPYRGETLPKIDGFDFIIIMGGPQSMLQIEDAPYLIDEIEFIKEALKLNKCILGICLGAQLIAEALGAKTEHSHHREVGMYLIELLDEAKNDPVFKHFPSKFEAMHWHYHMPGLPENAVLLAKSEGCPRQAFRYGDRVYGLQFHFEMTESLLAGMVENCLSDLVQKGKYVRPVKEILETDCSEINLKLESILEYLSNLLNNKYIEEEKIVA